MGGEGAPGFRGSPPNTSAPPTPGGADFGGDRDSSNKKHSNRMAFIKNQLNNRYNSNSFPPFVVHIEAGDSSDPSKINIGNNAPDGVF